MDNNDEAEQRPVVPAAALLFQAPEFVAAPVIVTAPQVNPANEGPSEEAAPKAKKKDSGSKSKTKRGNSEGKGKKPKPKESSAAAESAPVADEGSAPEEKAAGEKDNEATVDASEEGSHKRRRRRSRSGGSSEATSEENASGEASDQVTALKGSTRLEAKRMRRREGRREGRRRQSITESEFLARRESVDRAMIVRHHNGLDQIAVLEDDLLVEHYVARRTQQSIVGNIYLGRVQNVLPSMEAAFVDIGRGRNAVLYAGEVNWDSLGMEGKPRRIESALKAGDTVLVQVTKDPIGHKGARLTSQITLAGRYLVLVPGSSMLGISRKLPDSERARLKKILKEVVPEDTGVIVRTASEGATEEQLRDDVDRLTKQWADIERKQKGTRKAPQLLRGEPELVVRVVRDIFNEDFSTLIVQGEETWQTVHEYVNELSPELTERLEKWSSSEDVFHAKRIDQQLAKGMDRKVWLPSGGTLVIDRTEALTVIDVNTGKFIGSGGTLEETVTRNNLESAEEIVRQLRLRDIGGIIIIDFVDMVLESNRELVLRRLVECLGRDRTRHQVTEITSLGLVQMTRKRVGEGLVEAFSTTCEACEGRGFIVHEHPVEQTSGSSFSNTGGGKRKRRKGQDEVEEKGRESQSQKVSDPAVSSSHVGEEKVKTALTAIAAATVGGNESEVESEPPEAEQPAPVGEKVTPSRRRRVASAKAVEPTRTEAEPVVTVTETVTEEKTATSDKAKRLEEITLPEARPAAAKTRRRRVVTSDAAKKTHKSFPSEDKSKSAEEAVRSLLQE